MLENTIVSLDGPVGISRDFPPQPSWHWPTAHLEKVTVQGNLRTGIQFTNAWNAVLRDVTVQGPLTNDLSNPIMQTAIDLGNSMDVHLDNTRIVHAVKGVVLTDLDQNGHAEGFHSSGGWMQHVRWGYLLRGLGSGGWPTPLARLLHQHIALAHIGAEIINYTGVLVDGMNFYSEPQEYYSYGLVLRNCWHVTIANCHFWRNAEPQGSIGVVLDNCHNVVIQGCTAANTVRHHVYAVNGCTDIQLGTNGFMRERVVGV